jgi:hypothetical protein
VPVVTAVRVGVSDVPVRSAVLCVSCLVRVGRTRLTSVLRSVVCGPCWAAHGGKPAADEIGPVPDETLPVGYPTGQSQWLRELAGQDWVQAIRTDGHTHLMAIARTVAVWADWDSLHSRPTWAELMRRSGLERRSVARWLLELRLHGWLELLEHGSTPATRPMSLAHLEGNRAALYALRVPLTPQRALAYANELLMSELATELDRLPTTTVNEPAQPPTSAGTGHAATPDSVGEQLELATAVEINGTLPWSCKSFTERSSGGSSRARKSVDNSGINVPDLRKQRMSALRAGSEEENARDLSIMVPVSRYEMLACAAWLQHRLPVFTRCSRRLVRHLCKPLWRAGWSNRDIAWAMDHRPSTFGQLSSTLSCPDQIASPRQFIRSRLSAWRREDATIRPGYWTSLTTHAPAAPPAREQVCARHGHTGARLLRAGEHTLTAERISEHGAAMRQPAPSTNTRPRTVPMLDSTRSSSGKGRLAARAERERRRAELVARARAELARNATTTTTGKEITETPDPSPTGATAYDRALARARAQTVASRWMWRG